MVKESQYALDCFLVSPLFHLGVVILMSSWVMGHLMYKYVETRRSELTAAIFVD
jgi:hypothetical protein